MATVNVSIFVESRYRVSRKRLKTTVSNMLNKQEIESPVEVSIAVVGDRKMRELSRKYKGEDKTRNVLSFSLSEGEKAYDPSNVLRLGDIVISYPEVIREASRDEVLVDDKIDELVIHGLGHLLGLHHD
ncbi:MAG: rRNA maturation RNase YbeY [Candidatus Levybacteria bacterium RIFOXYA1_FULL_41_10]|nr:MAG: putative rRNA maturation factor [Candidatus Levybacteria bacterium GW2011_GWA1_39_34]KKR51282.1 MAG: putative rRNA maturation factor [Candidatus Levybacteria bacterium GW2011_GWC1_40_19]KKR73836.1 MAG: putative rRNA maturation factor [Candidatus Levybacteria bacterium GW2011_GWC2_40_7]KKR94631.1 MAG: putative rRNA maturation factor [Candidatus Levybacteria bacterium GW2011_GWA2_41_15]KKS02049.1 MAG: putative rRNA maturation factor [Candidatus Levybacteria bacterium GW2011_GWB1_41_21]OG